MLNTARGGPVPRSTLLPSRASTRAIPARSTSPSLLSCSGSIGFTLQHLLKSAPGQESTERAGVELAEEFRRSLPGFLPLQPLTVATNAMLNRGSCDARVIDEVVDGLVLGLDGA